MLLEEGKFYISNDDQIYGPAKQDPDDPVFWRLAEESTEVDWNFTVDGVFYGASANYPKSLKCEAPDRNRQSSSTPEKPSSEKQIYEMKLEDYQRGIDAIWDQRHNIGI